MASRKSAKTKSKTKSNSNGAAAPKKSAPVKPAAKTAKPAVKTARSAKPAAKLAKPAPKAKLPKVAPKAKPAKAFATRAQPTKAVATVAKIVRAAQAVAKSVTDTVQEAKVALGKKPSKRTPSAKPKAKDDDAPSEPAPAAGSSISVGSRAPSFSLKNQNGEVVSSASLAGKPYVLYFYPKDDTTGCTKQACGFRDSFAGFGKKSTRILGVSPDSEASHAKFAGKYGLPFTLLSDPDKELAQAYGVWQMKKNYGREYMGIQRSTFVVNAKGVVTNVYRNVRVDGHVDSVLSAVGAL
jgi:thioredoxin-dependent peroxiredoxin